MKRFSLVLAMLALALAVGFTFVACDDGSSNGGGGTPTGSDRFDNAFYGTWERPYYDETYQITFTHQTDGDYVNGYKLLVREYQTNLCRIINLNAGQPMSFIAVIGTDGRLVISNSNVPGAGWDGTYTKRN